MYELDSLLKPISDSMDGESLRYFLSTLPQVCAAVFSISLIFVVRKFDKWDEEIKGYRYLTFLCSKPTTDTDERLHEHISTSSCIFPVEVTLWEYPDFIKHSLDSCGTLIKKRDTVKSLFVSVSKWFLILVGLNFSTLLVTRILTESHLMKLFMISLNCLALYFYSQFQWKIISDTFLKSPNT